MAPKMERDATTTNVDVDEEAIKGTTKAESFASRMPQKHGVRTTLLLAVSSLGVIYGDIGTSPLYVMNAIFPSDGPAPSREDVIGACSAVIWSITLIPLIKYCLIALSFGTGSGEGGPFAVFSSLYPPNEKDEEDRTLTTYTTSSVAPEKRGAANFLRKAWVRTTLFAWVLFGTCLTMSDGLLTPAVSVVSAVEGMAVAVPKVAPSNIIVGISCAILSLLFLGQTMGTQRVSFLFAPIVAVWLALIGVSGIVNLIHHPGIFRAFDPSRAIMWFVRTKDFDHMSGVLLCITGVEAMFANLGQFSAPAIRTSFICGVYPCLVFAYLGQGARFIVDPETVIQNAFFNSVPGGEGTGFWWFTWIFAVLAAVVASQAMITATFSLIQQLSTLSVIPHLKIVHTNDRVQGQVFVPMVNALIFIGTIGLIVGFGTDAGLTNAYGFAVSGVLIITTCILAVAMVSLKGLPVIVAIAFFIFFGFIDGLFWGSSLKKVPHGAWFTLGLSVILWLFFVFWTWAKNLELKFDATHRHRLGDIIGSRGARPGQNIGQEDTIDERDETEGKATAATTVRLPGDLRTKGAVQLPSNQSSLNRLPVFALFHNPVGNSLNGAPHSFAAFVRCYPSLPDVTVFFAIRVVGVPHTHPSERFVVTRVRSFEGIYVATMRLGYRDPIDLSDVAKPLRDHIVLLESGSRGEDGTGPASTLSEKVARIDTALQTSVMHFIPHLHVSAAPTAPKWLHYVRSFFIETLYRRIKVNFDDTDAYIFEHEEQVLRMGIAASL